MMTLRGDAHCARKVDVADATALGAASPQADSYHYGLYEYVKNGLPMGGPFFYLFLIIYLQRIC